MPDVKRKLLLSPENIRPSRPDFKVIGVSNPGVAEHEGQIKLLTRVAETPISDHSAGYLHLPRATVGGDIVIDRIRATDLKDIQPQMVVLDELGRIRLRFISHLRLATSRDGITIDEIAPKPTLAPVEMYEEYGIEDARITLIGNNYYITYVVASRYGISTALAVTSDFRSYQRLGIILPPENKNAVLFPEKIAGRYLILHRPYGYTRFGMPEIWLAASSDLKNWGGHLRLLGGLAKWETARVGAGPPPIRTDKGWLVLYHGVRRRSGQQGVGLYSVGGVLLDPSNPREIVARAGEPLLTPEKAFEKKGYVPNVVFPTGCIQRGDQLLIFYGAADQCIGVAVTSLSQIISQIYVSL